MAFKAYTRKSSAIQGAKRAGLDEDAVVKKDGQWGFHLPETVAVSKLPKLSGGGGGAEKGASAIVEAIHQSSLSTDVAIYTASAALADKLGSVLLDIRDLLSVQNSAADAARSASELRKLEDDRESTNEKHSKKSEGGGFLPSIRRSMGGLFDMLRILSTPFILGALTELEKTFDILGKGKDKISKFGGDVQKFLDGIAELPAFKDNVLGQGIRNLLPILGGFGLFALWKPGVALKGMKGLYNAVSWMGKNPSIGADAGAASKAGIVGKASRILGKVAIPLTIITTAVEVVEGVIDGWKRDGAFGAFEGVVNGLVHGLIGGLIDTASQGIGWIIEQFGYDAERFKNFSFAKMLDAFGTNLGVAMEEMVESIKVEVGKMVAGFKDIWNSDTTIFTKMMDLITYPFKYLYDRFKQEFGGLSTMDAFKKLLAMATGNHSLARAAMTASEPPPKPPMQTLPAVQAVIRPQQSITGLITGTSSARLEEQARKAGLTEKQIAYTYETDQMIGAPKGATLAQLKQESGFNNTARSPTGAVGISQFTNVAVDDVLYGRGAKNDAERARRAEAKASLMGNTDKGLEYQRDLLLKIQRRKGSNWQDTMRDYNGDVKLERNGMQARDNYIQRIRGFLTTDANTTPVQKPNTGAALATTSEQVSDAKRSSGGGGATIAPINNSRTNVSNVTQNQLPNMTAATPVEFAPHVT